MAERPTPPTLLIDTAGEVLSEVLSDATREAATYFGDVPFQCVRCDARVKERVESYGGGRGYVLYEAEVLFAAIPQRTGPPPWQSDRAAPDDFLDDDDDDTKEVPIP